MKKLLFFILAAIAMTGLHAQHLFDKYRHNGSYRFDDTFKLLKSDVFTTYRAQFGLTAQDEMVQGEAAYLREDTADGHDFGSVCARYHQYHKGIPVEQKHFNVTSKCDVVLSVSGSVVPGLDIDTAGHLSDSDALALALNHINAPLGYSWQYPGFELGLKLSTLDDSTGHYDTTLTYYPKGELVIAKRYGEAYADTVTNYALCWKYFISHVDTVFRDSLLADTGMVYNVLDTIMNTTVVYVHAGNGNIWGEYDPSMGNYFTSGKVWTYYHGDRWDIENRTCNFCLNYKLIDHRNIRTYWIGKKLGNFGDGVVKGGDNQWVAGNPYERESASAHWCVEKAYDYYKFKQGVWHGNEINIIVNRASIGQPAKWEWDNNEQIDYIYTWSPGQWGQTSGSTLDILGHEFTHRVIHKSSQVGIGQFKFGDPYVINEGFADIFGTLVETWVNGSCDWDNGNNVLNGIYKRRFIDPENDYHTNSWNGSSATYQDIHWYGNHPYSSGGIIRKWFNHLSEGAAHWSNPLAGVGLDVAGRIAFITLYWDLWGGSDIPHLREQSLAVAEKFYGGRCGLVWNAVEKAWADVGVGTVSACNPLRIRGPLVVSGDMIVSGSQPVKFSVVGTDCESSMPEVLSYTWVLPAHWTGEHPDAGSFVLSDVGEDHSSQFVSVIVNYNDCSGGNRTDTLTTVLHLCDGCNDSGAGQGRLYKGREAPAAGITEAHIGVFPVPASRVLHVLLPEEAGNATGTLQDINGRTVRETKLEAGDNILSVSGLPSGVYMLRVRNKSVNLVKKVVVQ